MIGKAKIAFSVIILKPGAIGRVKRDYMIMQSVRSSCLNYPQKNMKKSWNLCCLVAKKCFFTCWKRILTFPLNESKCLSFMLTVEHPIWEVSVSYIFFYSLYSSWGPTYLTILYAKVPLYVSVIFSRVHTYVRTSHLP